jgi:hypothetical protein
MKSMPRSGLTDACEPQGAVNDGRLGPKPTSRTCAMGGYGLREYLKIRMLAGKDVFIPSFLLMGSADTLIRSIMGVRR